jgi:hypothetical protein
MPTNPSIHNYYIRWFGHVERRSRKTIRESTIMEDLEINELDVNIIYDRALWRHFDPCS